MSAAVTVEAFCTPAKTCATSISPAVTIKVAASPALLACSLQPDSEAYTASGGPLKLKAVPMAGIA